MKAVRFHEFGGPEVLRYEDVAQPTPGPGQVRIRVAATSFNGVDGNIRAGYMQGPIPVELPHTPGIDVAGTVDALGDDVHDVAVGDQVVGLLPMTQPGAAAEYVIAPAEILTGPRDPLLGTAGHRLSARQGRGRTAVRHGVAQRRHRQRTHQVPRTGSP